MKTTSIRPEPASWRRLAGAHFARRRARRAPQREPILQRALDELRRLPAHAEPTPELLASLLRGWDNAPWACTSHYLAQAIAETLATTGTVLETGSGLTTIVLAHFCAAAGRRLVALENDADWAASVRRWQSPEEQACSQIVVAPIRRYAAFDFYDLDLMPKLDDVGFVVCDGPPGWARNGRAAVMPTFAAKLRPDARILVDDMHRRAERQALKAWAAQFPLSFRLSAHRYAYATVRWQGASSLDQAAVVDR